MRRQRGAALLALMLAMVSLVAFAMVMGIRPPAQREPGLKDEQRGLALAAGALHGFALARKCANPSLALDALLPCPDAAATEGIAAPSCAATVRGWLPWKTLELPPVRDRSGTCLWYERQGAVARVIAAGAALPGQNRTAAGGRPVCGGNLVATNYLDGSEASIAVTLDAALISARCP